MIDVKKDPRWRQALTPVELAEGVAAIKKEAASLGMGAGHYMNLTWLGYAPGTIGRQIADAVVAQVSE